MEKPTLATVLEQMNAMQERLNNLEKVVNDLPTNELMLNNLASMITDRIKGQQQGQQGGLPELFYKLSLKPIAARSLRVAKHDGVNKVEICDESGEWISVVLPEDIHDKEIEGLVDYAVGEIPDADYRYVTVVGKGSPFPGYQDNCTFVNEFTGVRVKIHGEGELTDPNGITMVMLVRDKWTVLPVLDSAVQTVRDAFEHYNETHDEKLVADRYYDFVMFELFAQYEDFQTQLMHEQARPQVTAIVSSETKWYGVTNDEVVATVVVTIEGEGKDRRYNFTDPASGEKKNLTAYDIVMVQQLMPVALKEHPEATVIYLALALEPLPVV